MFDQPAAAGSRKENRGQSYDYTNQDSHPKTKQEQQFICGETGENS
jgi:hypothetical protein